MTNVVISVVTNVLGTNVLVSVGRGGFETTWIPAFVLLVTLTILILIFPKKKKANSN